MDNYFWIVVYHCDAKHPMMTAESAPGGFATEEEALNHLLNSGRSGFIVKVSVVEG